VSLKELQLPSIASLRAIAALKSQHLSQVRPARIGLGFEPAGGNQKTLAEIERALGGPGRLLLPYSLRLLLDVMTGLGVLHRTLGFVHGEVQPEHVLLGDDGLGRLMPVVRAHWVRGEQRAPERLYYLAPEKLLGDRVDVRADVFSVGVMLWEALSGQRLLEAEGVDDIIARLMGGGIPRAHVPEQESWTEPLAVIAERAIAVDPARRFATIAEMQEAINGSCQRYLASTPGMVELFQDPTRRARNAARDSVAPDSQRITLPPHQAPATIKPRAPASDGTLDAAATRLTQNSLVELTASSLVDIDLEEERTTKPNAAPLPTVARRPHVNTLLGNPPPPVDRDSSPHDELTTPFARTSKPAPVLVPPLVAPRAAVPAAPTYRAVSRSSTPLSFPPPPPQPRPDPRLPPDSPRTASLSPLIAARPAPMQGHAVEPSFQLMRPRKRRGALWLVIGAAAAIGLFAARPWLARQVATATGALPEGNLVESEAKPGASPAVVTSASVVGENNAAGSPHAVGIASTPASPASARAASRPGAPREEHVVIHDTIDPSIQKLRTPVEPPKPEATPEPPPPPPAPPPPPEPPAKSKSIPVSDGDRYGI
jgi:eukaryotic-like serine/threonine-protein kinase